MNICSDPVAVGAVLGFVFLLGVLVGLLVALIDHRHSCPSGDLHATRPWPRRRRAPCAGPC